MSHRELEQAVLGICAQHDDARLTAMEMVTDADFAEPRHRLAWSLIAQHGPGPELMIAFARSPLDQAWTTSLQMERYGSAGAIDGYCERLTEAARIRRLREAVQDAMTHGDTSDEIVGSLMSACQQVMDRRSGSAVKWDAALTVAGHAIADAQARHRAGGKVGLTFGIPALDHIVGGINGPRLVILAGRPATGKTAMLNQIALHNAANGDGGLIFSREMGLEELVLRGMASLSGVSFSQLIRGSASEIDVEAATLAASARSGLHLWVDTTTTHLDAMVAKSAIAKARHGIKWVAVDHIGLVQTARMPTKRDQIGLITNTLKQLAMQLQMPVFALSQLNRSADLEKRRPGLADLRDSGEVEQDADIVMFLHCDLADRQLNKRPIEAGFEKNRSGPAAWADGIVFDAITQRFYEEDDRYPVDDWNG